MPGLLRCARNDEMRDLFRGSLVWCVTNTFNYFRVFRRHAALFVVAMALLWPSGPACHCPDGRWALTVIEPVGRIQQGSAALPGWLAVTLRVPSVCTPSSAQLSPSIQ